LALLRALVGYEAEQRFFEIGSPLGLVETRALLAGAPIIRHR
jgi:hypothetical protein